MHFISVESAINWQSVSTSAQELEIKKKGGNFQFAVTDDQAGQSRELNEQFSQLASGLRTSSQYLDSGVFTLATFKI